MSDRTEPSVFVITVTCNDVQNLQSFIPSLMASDYGNFSLLVVDNASHESQRKLLDVDNPKVKVLYLKDNRGYAGACNAGIMYALENEADFVFLLNNDTTIAPEAISEMVNVAVLDAGIGIVGPLLLHMEPPDVIQEFGGAINTRRAEVAKFFENEKYGESLPEQKDVSFIGGGISLIRAEVFRKVGYFDENYFLYYDEVDFDTRVAAYGYRLVVTSNAKVWHDTGYSRVTKLRFFFSIRNKIYFARNNNNFIQFIYFNVYFIFSAFLEMLATLMVKGHYGVARVCLVAWYYGLINCMDIQKAKKILKLH